MSQQAESAAQSCRFERAILYFGNDWNAENRTSSHHMAGQLRRWTELVYIECPGLRAPSMQKRDLRKIFSKVGKALRGSRFEDGMRVYTLLQLPLHRSAVIRWVNRRLVAWQVARMRNGLRNPVAPVLWFVIPHLAYVPDSMRDCPTLYYCIDKYSALPGVDSTAIQDMDECLTKRADVVFVASETLLADKRRTRPDCAFSPHGVDFDLFNPAATRVGSVRPPDLPAWSGPVLGFFGLLESWIDLLLLAQIAAQRPDWLIVLIGRQAVDVSILRPHPNIVLIGHKAVSELPAYGRFFDIGMLPYLLTEQVINSNPVKLREYLAMGKAVVSVRFPHVEQFGDLVYLANDSGEFVAQAERALREDGPQKRAQRIAAVESTTWRARAAATLEELARRLNSREQAGAASATEVTGRVKST